MFTLSRRFTFEAAHQLPHHDGKCRRLHGHSWTGWVEVTGADLQTTGPKQGMVLDFDDLDSTMRPIVDEYLDHHFLNESLNIESPTSEAIALWLYKRLSASLPVTAITIEETCTCRCIYRPDV